jgi:hypothetical protein
VITAAVDNGLLSSLHTVSLKRSKCNWRNTSLVEKEEAREVGLCRRIHLGLQMFKKARHGPQQGAQISSYLPMQREIPGKSK